MAGVLALGTYDLNASGAELPVFTLSIKDHMFSEHEVRVPANQPFGLVVNNLDDTPEEFDSRDLKLEKVIKGGGSISMKVRPLKPGRYEFMGEYHHDTAKGTLIAE
jgi:hypothetical protein